MGKLNSPSPLALAHLSIGKKKLVENHQGRETPSVAVVVQPGAPDGGFHKAFFGKEEVAIPVVGR